MRLPATSRLFYFSLAQPLLQTTGCLIYLSSQPIWRYTRLLKFSSSKMKSLSPPHPPFKLFLLDPHLGECDPTPICSGIGAAFDSSPLAHPTSYSSANPTNSTVRMYPNSCPFSPSPHFSPHLSQQHLLSEDCFIPSQLFPRSIDTSPGIQYNRPISLFPLLSCIFSQGSYQHLT